LVRAIALARYGFQALAIDDVYAGVTVANGLWRLQAPSREGNAGTVGAEHGRQEVVGDFRECRSRRDLAPPEASAPAGGSLDAQAKLMAALYPAERNDAA